MNRKLFYSKLILVILLTSFAGCKSSFSTSAKTLNDENKTQQPTVKIENSTNKKVVNSTQKPQPKFDPKAEEDFWLGKYKHEHFEEWAAGGSYSVGYQVEIKKEQNNLVAVYENFQNEDSFGKTVLDVQVKNITALFYYDHCLPKESENEPCKNYVDKKGNLMFKLVKSVGKGGKQIILTYGEKNDSLPKGKVFLKKVKSFDE